MQRPKRFRTSPSRNGRADPGGSPLHEYRSHAASAYVALADAPNRLTVEVCSPKLDGEVPMRRRLLAHRSPAIAVALIALFKRRSDHVPGGMSR